MTECLDFKLFLVIVSERFKELPGGVGGFAEGRYPVLAPLARFPPDLLQRFRRLFRPLDEVAEPVRAHVVRQFLRKPDDLGDLR